MCTNERTERRKSSRTLAEQTVSSGWYVCAAASETAVGSGLASPAFQYFVGLFFHNFGDFSELPNSEISPDYLT